MDIFRMFQAGAWRLARAGRDYSSYHQDVGISKSDWIVLTSPTYWSAQEARRLPSILKQVISVSMSEADIPAVPLPGHYVAAVIATLVHPVNRIVAALNAPRTFDAIDASGLVGEVRITDTSVEQMLSLVSVYSSEEPYDEPLCSFPQTFLDQMLDRLEKRNMEREKEISHA